MIGKILNIVLGNYQKKRFFRLFWLFLVPFWVSCEQNLTLEIPEGEAKLIVEGHIEQDAPPVIVITRSVPVFSSFSSAQIAAAFVHNARVFISDGVQEYALQEVNSDILTPELLKLVAELYGFSPDKNSGKLPFTFYFYTSAILKGEVGRNYKLRIITEKETVTASTSIPHLNPIDSLWVKPHPDPKLDSLVALWYRYKDPDTVGNCVRYFTKRNREAFYPGYFSSVFIDDFVNGKPYIDFPLQRGEPKTKEPDFETFGYFRKGDTITVKWAAIDMAHYRFWNTLESDFGSRGNPFGAPVKIESNIKGGLGIWGGYGVSYHKIIVPN